MLTEKFRNTLPLLLLISFITLIYVPAALILLRGYETNIAFTQKELRGVTDYQEVIARYFMLYENADVDPSKAIQIRNQMRIIGDKSNLILDPEIQSYYAMDILFQHIPLLVEYVVVQHFDARPLLDVSYHLERLQYAVDKVSEFPSTQQVAISASFSHIHDQLLQLQSMNDQNKQFFLTQLKHMESAATYLLKDLLHTRLVAQQQHYHLVLLIVLTVYLVLMGLILFAVRNYADKREVKLSRERYQLIARLSQKNEELEKFSYATAHDLKEPVRTMRSFAMLLAEESASALNAAAQNYLDIIKNTAQRAEQMINDLLGYSTISNEKIVMERCEAREEIEAVLQDLQLRIQQTGARITVGNMPCITTVPSMFRRVMLNLIDNAIKYSQDNACPEIHISAHEAADGWQFCVSDNGVGIAPEHLISVFEPFRRLKTTTSEGNGIGLTTCKKIIERLGGRIWLESEHHKGTRVIVHIPL